jgi:aryl-alcohol dehydrogenase-like predicted oxidoreductase
MLKRNPLGATDLQVSVVGLGTVKWGRLDGLKYPVGRALPEDQEIREFLALARDLGINLLDTAPAYGMSEERLGHLLRGTRQQWVISTKAGEEWVNGASHFDFTHDTIRNSVERSLKRLQTDYIDVLLIHSHGLNEETLIEEEQVFEVLVQLKQEGKLRAFGMSSKTVIGGLKTVEQADVAMITFNADYLDEREVIALAKEKQKGILIKKALGNGKLPSEALSLVFNEPGITSVIVGTTNPLHLRENVALARSNQEER